MVIAIQNSGDHCAGVASGHGLVELHDHTPPWLATMTATKAGRELGTSAEDGRLPAIHLGGQLLEAD